MKVIAFNGSAKAEGNTYHALKIVAEELEKENIEVEIINVGSKLIRGCTSCGRCFANKDEKCVISNDEVNEWIQKMKEADGILLGSPVHFASMAATLKAFLDRAFYVSSVNGNLFRHKVGAGIVAVRRSGGSATFDQLNKFIHYSEMLMPTSNYWSIIHGAAPGEVHSDEEGVQIMRVLGKNMAWLMKLVEHGKGNVPEPEKERKQMTNFVR